LTWRTTTQELRPRRISLRRKRDRDNSRGLPVIQPEVKVVEDAAAVEAVEAVVVENVTDGHSDPALKETLAA
jgi:hypothetical protein